MYTLIENDDGNKLPDNCPKCKKTVDSLDEDTHWNWSGFGEWSDGEYIVTTKCPHCNTKFMEQYECAGYVELDENGIPLQDD